MVHPPSRFLMPSADFLAFSWRRPQIKYHRSVRHMQGLHDKASACMLAKRTCHLIVLLDLTVSQLPSWKPRAVLALPVQVDGAHHSVDHHRARGMRAGIHGHGPVHGRTLVSAPNCSTTSAPCHCVESDVVSPKESERSSSIKVAADH